MKKILGIQVLILVIASLFIGYYLGINKIKLDWKNYKPIINVSSKEPPPAVTNIDFAPFWTVWTKLETDYYDKTKLDSEKMLTGAINGMIGSLGDPFTVYLPPVQNEGFKQSLSGQFQGIGAELGTKDRKVIVIAPLNGSPAQKAGVKAGDTIVKVNDESTSDWTISQAVEKIRGPKGTSVKLTIVHKDQTKQIDINIVRDFITVKSVDHFVKKVGDIEQVKLPKENSESVIGYIVLSQFGDNTNKEWVSIAKSLKDKLDSSKNVEGIILDLRNNPGGYLTDATYIASEFLREGTVVVREEGKDGERTTLTAERKGILTDYPLVILINKGSASASEIVAGAIRDNNRGKLVGEASFGKGTIQQAEDLGSGAGLHVTIAKWLTPNGTWVNGEGLKPDISAAPDEKDPSHDAVLEKAIQELLK